MDDRSLEGWAKIILKDRYGQKGGDKMARKPRQNPLNATWEELGMKPGIRVPGTASWMAEWKRSPNQKKMIDYASEVHILVQEMSEREVGEYLKLYLSGVWGSRDETRIAAAIRRSPTWEAKYNQMEECFMSKKQADVVKKTQKKAEGASLKERIEALETDVDMMKKTIHDLLDDVIALTHIGKEVKTEKKGKKAKAEAADQPMDAEIKIYLKNLEAAKEAGDNKKAAMIRGKLRKAGYSLRANGKK